MKNIVIAIPTYNRVDLLAKLVDSIPSDIKISISDNGSFLNDNFKHKYKNTSIIQHANIMDIFYNWNAAIKNIKQCDYLAIPSDDDMYIPNSFDFIKDIINNNDADIFIFGNNFINEKDEFLGSYCPEKYKVFEAPYGLKEFLYGVDVRMPSVFFKKSFLDKIGYFDEKLFTLTAADSELVQRALLFGKVIFIPRIVSSYRVWEGSLTDKRIATDHWMIEIDKWTNKIIQLSSKGLVKKQIFFNIHKYRDEIYAKNILAGMTNLYIAKQYKDVYKHYQSSRNSKHALIKTKIRIWKILFLSRIKSLLC